MSLEIQNKIRNDINCFNYLMENSYWYKYLNRDDKYFKYFYEEMKKNYHLNLSDKIENTLNTIDMMQTIFMSMN